MNSSAGIGTKTELSHTGQNNEAFGTLKSTVLETALACAEAEKFNTKVRKHSAALLYFPLDRFKSFTAPSYLTFRVSRPNNRLFSTKAIYGRL